MRKAAVACLVKHVRPERYILYHLSSVSFPCSGVDFDDHELPFTEPNKSRMKVSLTKASFVLSAGRGK